jgi:tubulin polyglutamylase TTLL6/13
MSAIRIKLPQNPGTVLLAAVRKAGFVESFGRRPAIIEWKDKQNYEKSFVFVIINRIKPLDMISSCPLFCREVQKLAAELPKLYSFIPKTYILPFENRKFLKKLNKNRSKYVYRVHNGINRIGVINPGDFMAGSGELAAGQEVIDSIQIDQKRFSVTVFALIISVSPLKIYVYKEGLYTIEDNYFVKNGEEMNEKKPKLLSELLTRIEKEYGMAAETFWKNIDRRIVLSILACYTYLNEFAERSIYSKNFQLLSFDFVFDYRLKAYILSVNTSLDMNYASVAERNLKENLISEALNLAVPMKEMQEMVSARKNWIDSQSYSSYISYHTEFDKVVDKMRKIVEKNVDFRIVYPAEGKNAKIYRNVLSKLESIPCHDLPGT